MAEEPVTYTDKGGGGPLKPHGEDFFDRIVGVHWREKLPTGFLVQQALLKIGDRAVALDTGESFSGIRTGASGILKKPFTVFTSGVVVYGKPRNGDPCFMACVDGSTILRGSQSIELDSTLDNPVVWQSVYTVVAGGGAGLFSLSFAGGAFFVTYENATDYTPFCAVSFDGISFSEIGNIYRSVPLLNADGSTKQVFPGAVAYNGSIYATAGEHDAHPSSYTERLTPFIIPHGYAMMWGFSSNGVSWDSGYSPNEVTDPGSLADDLRFTSGSFAYTNIASGGGIFVAAAAKRTVFKAFPDFTDPVDTATWVYYSLLTAAAAVSNNGSSWTTIPLPGVIQAAYQHSGGDVTRYADSSALSVAFIQTGSTKSGVAGAPPIITGYFVMSANGVDGSSTTSFDATKKSWCFRGDGSNWALDRSVDDFSYGAVSAIAKDLKSTTIVTI